MYYVPANHSFSSPRPSPGAAAKEIPYSERLVSGYLSRPYRKNTTGNPKPPAGLYNLKRSLMVPGRESILAESWQRTLAGIPSYPGRLAYLASLRNIHSGVYEHFGLAQRIGESEADRLLRGSHVEIFQEWLCFGLERQKRELEEYLSDLPGDKRGIVATWLSIEPYGAWIPADSRDVERRLYYTDLSVVLELVRSDYGVSSRDPDL